MTAASETASWVYCMDTTPGVTSKATIAYLETKTPAARPCMDGIDADIFREFLCPTRCAPQYEDDAFEKSPDSRPIDGMKAEEKRLALRDLTILKRLMWLYIKTKRDILQCVQIVPNSSSLT